jgi:low temperature requirement protein LtrA
MVSNPGRAGVTWVAWLILGGTGLFIAGHAIFKIAVWRVVPWSRLAAVATLGLLGLAAPHVTALGLGICATAMVVAVAALDYYPGSHAGPPAADAED